MTTTPGPISVFRICEQDAQGNFYSLFYTWRGTRLLPKAKWLTAGSFTARVQNRLMQFCGFTAFRKLEDAVTFRNRITGRNVVIVECLAKGVVDHPVETFCYCRQLYVNDVIGWGYNAPEESGYDSGS